jgi:hypothetical protein
MTKGVIIALVVGVLVVGGFGLYLSSKKAAVLKNKPPLIGAGKNPLNAKGPPNTFAGGLETATSIVNSADNLFRAGKNIWSDFGGTSPGGGVDNSGSPTNSEALDSTNEAASGGLFG